MPLVNIGEGKIFSSSNPLKFWKVLNKWRSLNRVNLPIEALVLKKTVPRNRSEQELAGYRDALALIHESGKFMDFSVNIILQLHSLLYRYMPNDGGRWKMVDNEIVEKNPDGTIARVRFKPVPAVVTPFVMEDLGKNYSQAIHNWQQEPLIVVPLVILDFLCIHPFTDGNGRTSRLLALLLLYHFDYQVGKYISLERIFEESKESYYETLEYIAPKAGMRTPMMSCLGSTTFGGL